MNVTIHSQGLQRTLGALPHELNRAMIATGHRIAQRFLGFHRARRLHGGDGVKATRKGWLAAAPKDGGGARHRIFTYTLHGTTMNSLRLDIGINSYIAHDLEVGSLKRARRDKFPVPFGSMTRAQVKRARKLIVAARHKRQAGEHGFKLTRGKGREIRSAFIIKSKSGKEYWAIALPGAPKGWGAKRVKILFSRHPQVQMKRRLKFYETWKQFLPNARKIYDAGVAFALRAARRKGGQARVAA